MDVTEKELDDFIEEVERRGFQVTFDAINAFGDAEVLIERNEFEIRDIVYDLGFRDYDITSYTTERIAITLF
jgi:hypothetical protein